MNETEKLAALTAEAARAKTLADQFRQANTVDTSFGALHCRWRSLRLVENRAQAIENEIEELRRELSTRPHVSRAA